jgi:hypothetical protein
MNYKHGECETRFYKIWAGIKSRCKNPKRMYFEKGIQVCERWNDYNNFKLDMHDEYMKHVEEFSEENTTIDRIDVNGNYEPENCRWATYEEQAKNKTNNIFITYNNETLCFSDWSNKLNIPRLTLLTRLELGWSIEKTFTTPVKRGQKTNQETITFNNETKTIKEWSEITGLLPCTIRIRIRRGWTPERILTTTANKKEEF